MRSKNAKRKNAKQKKRQDREASIQLAADTMLVREQRQETMLLVDGMRAEGSVLDAESQLKRALEGVKLRGAIGASPEQQLQDLKQAMNVCAAQMNIPPGMRDELFRQAVGLGAEQAEQDLAGVVGADDSAAQARRLQDVKDVQARMGGSVNGCLKKRHTEAELLARRRQVEKEVELFRQEREEQQQSRGAAESGEEAELARVVGKIENMMGAKVALKK
jgi:hypothetical protein